MTDITNATEVEKKVERPALFVGVIPPADTACSKWLASDAYTDASRLPQGTTAFRLPSTADADNGGSKKSDPTDAAELERLREAKYQAELDMRTTAMSRDVPTAVSPRVWNAWITACDRLSAFEKTIGGGS